MAATVVQAYEVAPEVIGESADVPYNVFDAADEAAIRVACTALIPATYADETMSLKTVEIDKRLSIDSWRVIARYAKPTYLFPGSSIPDSRFAFDTAGGTQHITQSLENVGRYAPPGKTAPDEKGAIGFDGKNVAGVDIHVPVFQFSETHYFRDATVTNAFKRAIMVATSHVNSGTFRGHAAGEVLFLGASGQRQGDDTDDLWEISYRFMGQENKTGLSVGDITGIAKKGWQYLWIKYAESTDESQLIKPPVAAYVERVYYSADFSTLGIDEAE